MNVPNCDIIADRTNENAPHEKILSSGIQLRTSARVLKKQKLDLEASLAAAESKKEEKLEVEVTSSSQPTAAAKQKRGVKVFWSPEDKTVFFEAVNEAGKDLEGIERYMRGKAKKRPGEVGGPSVTSKTRLQVKSFYYRTLLKVGKHVQLPDNVKRSTQELYILINYGELRKRIGLINERNAQKLKELIYCGSTQVRVKGKTWRVKTPVCRALKRLNQLEESVDEIRLPLRVEVLLSARENRDRHLVESLGYNPRLKTTLSVDTPVQNLISFLQARWNHHKEQLTEGDQSVPSNLQDRIPDPGGGGSSFNTTCPHVPGSSSTASSGSTPTVDTSIKSSVNSTNTVSSTNSLPDLNDCFVVSSLSSPTSASHSVGSVSQQNTSSDASSQNASLHSGASSQSAPNSGAPSQSAPNSGAPSLNAPNSGAMSHNTQTSPHNTSPSRNSVLPREQSSLITSNTQSPPQDNSGSVINSTESPLISQNLSKNAECSKSLLRIGPKSNAQLTKTNYKCGQLVTSSCISLIAHQAKIGSPLASLQTLIGLTPPPGVKAGKSWAKWHKEGEPVDDLVNTQVCDPVVLPGLAPGSQVSPSTVNQNSAGHPPAVSSSSLPLQTPVLTSPEQQELCRIEPPLSNPDNQFNSKEAPVKEENKEEFESRIRKGWRLNTSARLRIADLYLIFGSNGKLEIDYWWDVEVTSELPSLLRLLSLARLWSSGIPSSSRECWACGHKTLPVHTSLHTSSTTQSASTLLLDPKVEVKTEVVENAASTVVVVSPAPSTAGRFRQPLLPAPSSTKRLKSTDETYKSLQLKPKYSNRRGRYRPKNVVVQRMLPLLPKASAPAQSCTVVTLQVLAGGPAGVGTGEFIKSKVDSLDLKPIAPKPSPISTVSELPVTKVVTMGEVLTTSSTADIVDILEPVPSFNFLNNNKLPNGEIVKSEPTQHPNNFSVVSGLLGGSSGSGDSEIVATPPTSPSRILKEGESQWLNSEVSDFSLSSFLGHLESPLKTNGGILSLEDTRMSADVDSQLQSLMTETSLDYTAKFADLAAKIAGGPGSSNGTPTAPS